MIDGIEATEESNEIDKQRTVCSTCPPAEPLDSLWIPSRRSALRGSQPLRGGTSGLPNPGPRDHLRIGMFFSSARACSMENLAQGWASSRGLPIGLPVPSQMP